MTQRKYYRVAQPVVRQTNLATFSRRFLASFLLAVATTVNAATLFEADDTYRGGQYRDAAAIYTELFTQDLSEQEKIKAAIGLSRSYAMTGEMRKAEAAIKDNTKKIDNAALTIQLAEVAFAAGQSDKALGLLQSVATGNNPTLRSLVVYAEILRYRGRYEEAEPFLLAATAIQSSRMNSNAEELTLAAHAHWMLENFQDANALFREATRIDPGYAEAHIGWGDLFREKYNAAEALQSYQSALDVNPYHPDALIGMALTSRRDKPLEKALFTNPRSADAYLAYAELALKQNKFREAESYLNAALPNNEEHFGVLTALAGVQIVLDREKDFKELEKDALAIQPNSGRFYTTIAEYFGNDYRFKEAIEFARKAIAVQPDYWQAYTVLGMNLIRLGDEAEGQRTLQMAFERDPYNVWTSNMLKVFDTLDSYVSLKSEHFIAKMSEKDALVLWPYMEPLLEEAWDTLSKKYDFVPEGPILIEVFDKQEDFAVRSVGLPDIGPLVGICFGKVITMISPDTLDANWQEIAWHEFAHIITLQMTNNRMPRWLSEGISVYEEFQGRDEWGRRQELDIVRGRAEGRFLPVERMDDAFMLAESDDDLSLAYLQSYLVVEFIVQEFGFDNLKKLIKAYDSADPTADIIVATFDDSLPEFNKKFDGWLEDHIADINVYVDVDDMADQGAGHGHGVKNNSSAMMAEQYSADSLKRYMLERLEQNPRDFQAHLQLGLVFFRQDQFAEAEKHLKEAKKILPYYTSYPSPSMILTQLYEKTGDEKKYRTELEYLVKFHQHEIDASLELAELNIAEKNLEQANYYLQRAIAVDPYRADIHRKLATVSESSNLPKQTIREYEILVELDNTDPVDAFTKLAGAYLNDGQDTKAKSTSLKALEIAPTYKPAQRVLLQSIGEDN